MACLGVHFALSDEDVAVLLSKQSDEDRLAFVQEDLEERYFEQPGTYIAQSDKAWDAMHRALADGSLGYGGGTYPLNHVVLGGRSLYGHEDYLMSLKTPAQASDIAGAISGMTEDLFRARYEAIDPAQYGLELSDEDFQYTWGWFQEVRALYQTAAAEGRHVLFTADQ